MMWKCQEVCIPTIHFYCFPQFQVGENIGVSARKWRSQGEVHVVRTSETLKSLLILYIYIYTRSG